ncbi:Nict2, partial [Symbiodinium microadriaticum]
MAPKSKASAKPKRTRAGSLPPRRRASPAPSGAGASVDGSVREGSKEPAASVGSKEKADDAASAASTEVEAPPVVVSISKETIKTIFSRFDLNGNGTIEQSELAMVFQVLAPRQWSSNAIKRLFDGMDINEDGHVQFTEFIEWIFDTGTNSFKGALEIAETTDGAKTLEWSVADIQLPIAAPDIRTELEIIDGFAIEDEIKKMDPYDLKKLESLTVVPDPIRRVLEAVYLLLLPSSGLPSISALTPPEWSGIQDMLKDSSTCQRVMNFKARKEEMKTRPLWGSYAARRFFTVEKVDADIAELEGDPPRPLSYERVLSSCQSLFGSTDGKNHAIVLMYKWIIALLVPDLKELADQLDAKAPGG